MIRTFLEFELAPGGAEVLLAVFERHRILDVSVEQPGCESAELTITEDRSRAIVTAVWSERSAYDAWTSRGDRSDLADELNKALLRPIDETTVGQICTVEIARSTGTDLT